MWCGVVWCGVVSGRVACVGIAPSHVRQAFLDYSLLYVGGVMLAVCVKELIPQVHKPNVLVLALVTMHQALCGEGSAARGSAGLLLGAAVMGVGLVFFGEGEH